MIAILGIKRVMALGVLSALCLLFAGAGYGYFMPENQKQSIQLRQLQAQITEKKTETNKLRTELDEIREQKSRFENLRTAGFFSNQNRLVAKKRILDIQKRTGVLKASYNIATAEVFESEQAKDAAHVVLKSPMNIVLEAMDDKDIINYIFWLENTIPGHLTIDSLTMRRTQDLNEASLRQIGSGQSVTLVNAEIDLSWRTLISEESVRDATDSFYAEGY